MKTCQLAWKKTFLLKITNLYTHQIIHQNFSFFRRSSNSLLKLPIPKLIFSSYIATIRQLLIKSTFRKLYFWYYTLLTQMITKKPREIRMGKGKGSYFAHIERFSTNRYLFGLIFSGLYTLWFIKSIYLKVYKRLGFSSLYIFKFFFFKSFKKLILFSNNFLWGSIV